MLKDLFYFESWIQKENKNIAIFRIYSNPKFLSLKAMHQRQVVAFNESLENTIGETS